MISTDEADKRKARYELSDCFRLMIDRLSPADYEAIILVELEGLTHQEAATKLTTMVKEGRV